MVSTLNLADKYNQVRRNFCFYLDIEDHGLSKSISRRLQDMGLQQEVFLTSRVTHVIRERSAPLPRGVARGRWRREAGRARADAMLERVRPAHQHYPESSQPQHNYILLNIQKALSLLDKLYDTFFVAPRKNTIKLFSKHYIKIEFLDKVCRPVYKEFDEWPRISIEVDQPKENKDLPEINLNNNTINQNRNCTTGQKMTRKSRPRIKDKEEKETKGGYCEMCNTDYVDAALHRRSQTHLAFVRDHTNFLALDSLIGTGADVTAFLDRATGINGERRSLRKMCNGDIEQPKTRRSKQSQSPDSTVNGNQSPRRNGGLEDEKKHNTRCAKKSSISQSSEDRQYYKVVGVSTKLRSSSGFTGKKKDSPPTCNGAKPLVVKFRKVRRSELSVLSDEAEQFMFPKRASSSSSTSSSDGENDDAEDKDEKETFKQRSPVQPPPTLERRRMARPLALKEESSEEDSWIEDMKRRKRKTSATSKKPRRLPRKLSMDSPPEKTIEEAKVPTDTEPVTLPETEINPLREEPLEKCMKWEDGKLKYTPAVEQLEFAFESVPHSETWYATFKRQDQDKVVTRNVPQYFALYSKSPKLPYEVGHLPPLKPNCCPLSDLVKREERPGPSRSYGTRGMKNKRFRKRTAAIIALENQPRKSPREHASTLAILGSAGLLHRHRHVELPKSRLSEDIKSRINEDTKSTASEDTLDTQSSNMKLEPIISENRETSERLQQFLSEVFDDASEFDMPEDVMEGEPAVTTSTNIPDVLSLVSECEDCDIIRDEIKQSIPERIKSKKGKFKKKNRTGWPKKKKLVKKSSRTNSLVEAEKEGSSLGRSSAELPDDDTTQDSLIHEDINESESEDRTLIESKTKSDNVTKCDMMDYESTESQDTNDTISLTEQPMESSEKTIQDIHEIETIKPERVVANRSSQSSTDSEDKEEKKRRRKRVLQGLLMQPVVRVARVDPNAARILRSSNKTRSNKLR